MQLYLSGMINYVYRVLYLSANWLFISHLIYTHNNFEWTLISLNGPLGSDKGKSSFKVLHKEIKIFALLVKTNDWGLIGPKE